MNTLSLCMIVRDEELTLNRVLSAAKVFADEIIVVDTGSTDSTQEIALNAGCKVYRFEWISDFSAARNYAFSLAKSDYVMWLDADDVISPRDALRLKELKGELSADVVMLPYYMGNPPSLVFYRERILRRSMGMQFKGAVHEAVEVRGTVAIKDIPIVHEKLKKGDPKRNLAIFEKLLKEKGDLAGREAFYYGSELYYNGNFDKAKVWLNKFLGESGNASDKGQASLFLSRMESEFDKKIDALSRGLGFVFSPDLFCARGEAFLSKKDYRSAKNDFLSALVADERITFVSPECSGYIPHIKLCICYWYLGDKNKSKLHNDSALSLKPDDFYARANAKLFTS